MAPTRNYMVVHAPDEVRFHHVKKFLHDAEKIGSLRDGVAPVTTFADLPDSLVCLDFRMDEDHFSEPSELL